jgi:2Fe-2S ferredoxin
LTGDASEDEAEMLEFGVDVDARSRLGCQIMITDAMDGLTVHTPRSQR